MDEKQVEIMARAAMAEQLHAQQEAAHRTQARSSFLQSRGQRLWGLFAALGAAAGAALGYFAFRQPILFTVFGFCAGGLAGAVVALGASRKAAP